MKPFISRMLAPLFFAASLSATSVLPSTPVSAASTSTPELAPAKPLVQSVETSRSSTLPTPITRSNAATSSGRLSSMGSNDVHNPGNPQGPLDVDLTSIRRVKVAGSLVPDQPQRVGNLDIVAPIIGDDSVLLSQLGATASRVAPQNVPGNINTPTNSQSFQLNLSPRPPIVLTINSSIAYINGQEQQLRAAPLLIGGKIWLPVFSIAPLLGASVRLHPDGTLNISPTIQSVEVFPVGKNYAVTIQASAPLPEGRVLVGTMDKPDKVYFDFSGFAMGFDAAGSIGERVVSVGAGDVQQVRAGMPQTFPDITRVVLDLKKKIRYVVQPTADKTVFALLISGTPNVEPKPNVVGPKPPAPPEPRIISNGSLSGLTIVVDAGHGGHDPGAPGKRSREKDHTLDISKRLRRHLEARGANVLMTRDGDYFISLQGRTDFANSRRANLFVSVHIDSFKSTSAGTTTYYNAATSQPLAREVHNELYRATGLNNRGVKQARFFVVRKTWMPSILTEIAFISNPREEALLMTPAWRERVARGLADGVTNYVRKYGVN